MGLTNKYMVISSGYDGYNGIIHPLNGKNINIYMVFW